MVVRISAGISSRASVCVKMKSAELLPVLKVLYEGQDHISTKTSSHVTNISQTGCESQLSDEH